VAENKNSGGGIRYDQSFSSSSFWRKGRLQRLDQVGPGDDQLVHALKEYSDSVNQNRQGVRWSRTVNWIENILFSSGRQYLEDIIIARVTQNQQGDLSLLREITRNIPKPTNDILGRYLETNVALLTENRPRPRVTPKSDSAKDIESAELSELTLEYLWEALNMPEKHREIARLILHCGLAFMEIYYDPTKPRRLAAPATRKSISPVNPEGIPGTIPIVDEFGRPLYADKVEYGDIVANVVSPFEMHFPNVHRWEDINWVLREYFLPIDVVLDRYTFSAADRKKYKLTRQNGWYLDNLKEISPETIQHLPIWWWERISDLVEGGGPSLYIGSPSMWDDYVVVRVFDRKPNATWPRGRTVITIGGKVIYDSPKKVGARVYDPRWPERWHPYVLFRWEPQVSSIYARSLVSKLLPKLKRVNAIDMSLIMWRRTVPIATWIAPKGTMVVEDQVDGTAGNWIQYDPRQTAGSEPKPVYPPPYPREILEERMMQIQEMEAIAGTEEILRGQRPVGTQSAAMLDILRKQALASRSAIIQAWDESLQQEGSALLQEVIKNVKEDSRYADRISLLAREKHSRLTIQSFAGADLSDNVVVRVDTASMALVSKEAREAKALEVLRYGPALAAIPDLALRQALIAELGLKKEMQPSGPDVNRAKKMISLIKDNQFKRIMPFPDDNPYIFYEFFKKEMQSDSFWDLNPLQQKVIIGLIDYYKRKMIEEQQQQLQMQLMLQSMNRGGNPQGGSR